MTRERSSRGGYRIRTPLRSLVCLGACGEPGERVAARIEAACGRLLIATEPAPGQSDAALIMKTIGLDPERCEWEEIEQPFCRGYRVYRVRHGIAPLPELVAAVDPQLRVIRLTNDRPISREQRALRCFNEISRSEGVRIGESNLGTSLRFFVVVHVGRTGQYLRDRARLWRSQRFRSG